MSTQLFNLKNVYQQYLNDLNSLRQYIDFNKESEQAHYKEYKPIVYGAIINRAYSSWETFTKELFYEYFSLNKDEYIKDGTFIKRYKIHELPAYLLESVVFSPESETFNLKLNKDLLIFTSKNIELKELTSLYSKIDIPIVNYIEKSDFLVTFVEEKDLPLSNDRNETKIARALRFIITERNRTSHNSTIENYLDIDILEEWVTFFEMLGFVLFETVILLYTYYLVTDLRAYLGPCKQIVGETIGCFDVEKDLCIQRGDMVLVYRGPEEKEELVDILIAKSFKVENQDKDYLEGLDKAGCVFKSLIYDKPKIKLHYKYYVLNNSEILVPAG